LETALMNPKVVAAIAAIGRPLSVDIDRVSAVPGEWCADGDGFASVC
jgi:hypothetical protein